MGWLCMYVLYVAIGGVTLVVPHRYCAFGASNK